MQAKNSPNVKKMERRSGAMNLVLWLLILTLLAAGFVANACYSQVAGALRMAGMIVLLAVVTGLAGLTTQGKKGWSFIKGSRAELRKVVWPTRQETIQTTVVVVVMVLATAIILWGLDTLFLWLVSLLTGQRG